MKQARILIVEDEDEVRRTNKGYLEAQGYTVDCAGTLADAREVMDSFQPDLILLDVLLPDGSGYDFCAEIRKKTSVPIIYLTCMDKNENIVNGLALGGDDYIIKPYSLEVMSARVMATLRRSEANSVGRIELPPLSINLQNGQVTMDGMQVELSPKELQLLAFLASNIGKRFSAEEIFRSVWADASGVETNTVKTHISTLRKKLHLHNDAPFELRAVKNEGYVFTRLYEE